jgi:predicted ribosomally synthesized peptide with SipW-like signal peptide
MDKTGLELSRRKILAGLGAIGAASAGVGLGTSAYFSDQETFTNNRLVAGSLDLKVDWEEHYSDWSDDEAEGIETVSMEPGEGLVGFPSAAPEKTVYVSDPDQFLANTAIEAFPDAVNVENPDEITAEDYDGQGVAIGDAICDFPADLDGVLSHPFRTGANVDGGVTIGDGPNAQTTAAGDPLVNISDVKPGDFGEVTFSFHLCGNPGYVWLTGNLIDASENGVTEPEMKDPDEDYPEGDTVELLDAISAAIWYDTGEDGAYGTGDEGEGDNFHQEGEAFIPLTGSLRNVLSILEEGMVPLDYSPLPGGTISMSQTNGDCVATDLSYDLEDVDLPDNPSQDSPFTNDELGFKTARDVTCEELDETLVVLGVVEESTEYVGTKIEAGGLQPGTYTAGNGGIIQVNSVDIDGGTVTLSTNFPIEVVSVKGGAEGANHYVFEDRSGGEDTHPEEFGCILDQVTFETPVNPSGENAGISNIRLCWDPDTPTDGDGEIPAQEDGRECFPNSTTAYVGFEWWLPVDHANEIQTDSASFDLGFYTEQCRHNDGEGMAAEVASVDIPDTQTVTVEEDGSTMVHVDRTTLPEGGYVVLHNEAGPVIGNTDYLSPGTHGNLEITVPNADDIIDEDDDGDTTVVAMAHKDTDDDQTYDFPNADGPYTIDGDAVVDPGVVNVEDGS